MTNLFDDQLHRRWDTRNPDDDRDMRLLDPGRELWLPPSFDTIPEIPEVDLPTLGDMLKSFIAPDTGPHTFSGPLPPSRRLNRPPAYMPMLDPEDGISGWVLLTGEQPDLIA